LRVFELFHLSLLPRERDMFDSRPELTREQWIRVSLSEQFKFTHRKKEFYWVPKDEDSDIVGIVERQTERLRHRSPEQGGTEVMGQEWQGVVIIIDPTPHDTGQRVAFERDAAVGTASSILRSLLEHVSSRPAAQYTIEAKPVFDTTSFWAFAGKHNQVLRQITFDFVVPNMWGTRTNLEKELRSTGEETGAQKAQVRLSGQDGVKTDNKLVKDGVAYAGEGGGSVTARALDGERFTSKSSSATTKIQDDDVEGEEQISIWKRMASKILRRDE